MAKILIVDDHAVVRRGMKQILDEELGDATYGEAASAVEALQKLSRQCWDLIVLDISLPGRSGLDLLKELRSTFGGIPVLVVSIHPEEVYAVRVLRAGGAGYLSKDSAASELGKAVRKILSGGRYVSSALAEYLATHLDGACEHEPHELLSDREYEVLRLISCGKTAPEIADILHISAKTVSTYRTRLLRKMGLRTNADIAAYAVRNNLIN